MQIQIKQADITNAVKDYISKQGINLTGKTVQITFVAGRKGTGIYADIVITDGSIPGFEGDEEVTDKPVIKSEGVVGTIGPKETNKAEEAKPDQSASDSAGEVKAATPTLFN